jgi:glycosyltransferase involved in cell wall biosynthesis
MRIGIDAREVYGRATGVGRYLGGLIQEWSRSERARRHEFVLYVADRADHAGLPNVAVDGRRFVVRARPGSGGTWWEQVTLPAAARHDNLDVFFSPAYTAPLRTPAPLVVAIHDLSFVAHPEWFRLREGARRRWLCRQAAHNARAVITISEFSRHELEERLNVAPDKIHVIPPGIGAGGWGLGAGKTAAQSPGPSPQSPSDPRVLYVGSIFNRRHVVDLIRAFAPIARAKADASLDIVGDNRSYPREDIAASIAAQGLEQNVRWHQYVSDDELRALYSRAGAFVFLSEYEGLGLTPLEALASGVPPILLDTPVARESCGDAALYVPLHDWAATTRAIELALFSTETRTRVLTAAPAVLARYNWQRAAADTLAVLERAGSARSA